MTRRVRKTVARKRHRSKYEHSIGKVSYNAKVIKCGGEREREGDEHEDGKVCLCVIFEGMIGRGTHTHALEKEVKLS